MSPAQTSPIRMNVRASFSLSLLLLAMSTFELPSQGFGDDDNLFIPPSLTVESRMRAGKPKIEVSQSQRHDWLALLPALFFDNPGDWTIPERYQLFASATETREYADSGSIPNSEQNLKKYHEILNVLGSRLLRYPDATLALRGCYSAEGGESPSIARERALVVREYLANVWSIDTMRLPLLPVVRRADTLASNPIQEEARRVEFEGSRPELLQPARFTRAGFSAYPTMLTVHIVPNMEPAEVDSIELIMLDESQEVQDRKSVPGHSDSSSYTLNVMWEQTSTKGEEGMTLVARVRSRDGLYRPSNSVFMPVHVSRSEPKPLKHDFAVFEIPFTRLGSPEPGLWEEWAMRHMVDYFHEGISEEDRHGYVVMAHGKVDMAEHPGFEPTEVNVRFAAQEVERREREAEGKPEYDWSGRLMIFVPIEEESNHMRSVMTVGSKEEYEESQRKIKERREEERRRRVENPALTLSDSLADRRAEWVMAWLVDSLELPLINSELPENAGRMKSHRFFGENHDEEEMNARVVTKTAEMRKGVVSSANEGGSMPSSPEERWYARGVRVEFWTREHLEMMEQMARQQ